MALSPEILSRILAETLPARGDSLELSQSNPGSFELTDEGGLKVTLALAVLEGDGTVRDIKEQQIHALGPHGGDLARAEAYLRAWLRSTPAIARALGASPDALLPSDLCFPEAFGDALLVSQQDFEAAFGDRERLAGWQLDREREQAQSLLGRWGLQDRWREYLATLLPTVGLLYPELEEDDERDDNVGCTRLGGEPDLPRSFRWPKSGERPMTFAAQLDLAELAGTDAGRILPKKGLLSFFYDPFHESVGGVMSNPCVVRWFGPDEELQRRRTPKGGDLRPSLRVSPEDLGPMAPPAGSPFYEALLPVERVLEFRKALAAGDGSSDPLRGLGETLVAFTVDGDEYAHRVLGHCKPYQGDPYLEAELHSSGVGFGGWVEGSREAVEASRRACRWRLLLQLNAQWDEGLLFEQDCGFLYFMIPDDALAARDFRQVFCVIQMS